MNSPMSDIERLYRPDVQPEIVSDNGLAVISLAKTYDKRQVLRDVSLSVQRGEVVGLLGPNGAGKTTCFYSVMGLVKPDHGRIFVDGTDITELPMYRRAVPGLGDRQRLVEGKSVSVRVDLGGSRFKQTTRESYTHTRTN